MITYIHVHVHVCTKSGIPKFVVSFLFMLIFLFRYQNALLDAMVIGPNTFIAKNAALRENVFMMVVCIELRIPLYLIGKPGSSKSLAKSIVSSSMQGKASKNYLLRCFKQVISVVCMSPLVSVRFATGEHVLLSVQPTIYISEYT